MINLEFLDAQFYGLGVRARQQAKDLFESSPEHERVIVMLDLVASTNHRFFRGPAEAYQRTVVFYGLCQHIFAYTTTLEIIKEMGDGILAVGSEATEALEACFILKRAERLVRNEFPDDLFPFQIRMGVGYGTLKRLAGPRTDFLGSAIDELSRIMSDKTLDHGLLVSRAFRERAIEAIARYPFVELGAMRWWSDKAARVTHDPIEYYPMEIDFSKMLSTDEAFIPWASKAS